MICWSIQNGVPFDVAHNMFDHELLSYSIVFASLKNGGQEWDWDRGGFIEKR
ncbi:hypothetical protein [Bradyrhizobium sp. Tv2a-2]|uniref:hypothetical protein n=1 Tax=Bradyrhizobium sp. Tv2a-2 TaxID=113395 RepID=UPI00042852D2|nr:hypothetical protein [Bradyrhizobium sp. Tv2a-2]